MSKSWREWSKYTNKTPRKHNRSSIAHCCKLHHDWDAREFDKKRDLREGKQEHQAQMRNALQRDA